MDGWMAGWMDGWMDGDIWNGDSQRFQVVELLKIELGWCRLSKSPGYPLVI